MYLMYCNLQHDTANHKINSHNQGWTMQLNRLMNWHLPTHGPKTLNGLIIEKLETIPAPGTGLTVADYPIEILDTNEHAISKVRVSVPAVSGP